MSELIRIGTAGWAIPRQCAEHFPRDGSGLERYAARFTAVEINSTFHRSHKPHTFARWAEAVPEGFRFAVKMPNASRRRDMSNRAHGQLGNALLFRLPGEPNVVLRNETVPATLS
jgi:uncharacterized protein YecE (DUF72 family)